MREILDFALPNSNRKKLLGIDSNIYEEQFMKQPRQKATKS